MTEPLAANDTSLAGTEAGQTEDAAAPRMERRRLWRLVARYVPLALLFLAWELVSRSSPDMALMLPAPTAVFKGGIELVQQGTLQKDILASLHRVGVAVAFAALIGF